MKRVASVAAGLILALGVAACNEDDSNATSGADDQQNNQEQQDSTAPEEEADGEESEESDQEVQDGDELTLTGETSEGTEPNCMLLDFKGETYQLTGEEAKTIKADVEVEVTGKVAESTMTTCQEGTPFEVEAVSVK